jgi:ABC-type polysaccharide/polyol phosphate export permease
MQIVNPMAALVNAFREVVYHQRWPRWECVLVAGGISVVLLACGLLVMRRLGPYMAEEL